MKSLRLLVVLIVSVLLAGCAAHRRATAPSTDDTEQLILEMNRVESAIDELVVNETAAVGNADSLRGIMLAPRKHELFVVAAHFFDDRAAWVLGTYDNGSGGEAPKAKWTVGDSLFFIFQKAFYPDRYVENNRPYLISKAAAIRWMSRNSYDLDKMRAEFDADQR